MIKLSLFRTPQIWWYFFAGAIFIFLILRALLVPIVHDEAATFFHYVHAGYFFPPKALWDANNHYLNTILTWCSYQLFGASTIALRLPNLLSFILFAYSLIQIALLLKNTTLQWILIFTLFLCHGFIEFFGLSRGYGLSMALITTTCWFCIKFLSTGKIKFQVLILIFGFLSLAANLTLLNTLIIILSYIQLFIFLKNKENGIKWVLKSTLINVIFGGFIVLSAIALLFKMKVLGLLYYGKLAGFLDFSLPSFLHMLFENIHPFSIIISIFLIGLIGITSIQLISIQNKLSSFFSASWLFPLLFFGNLCAVVLMAKFLKINHPEDRTGLYFVLFFILSLIFIADELIFKFRKKWLIILALPLIAFPIDFIKRANTNYVTIWKEEYLPEKFYYTIAAEKSCNPTIGGYFMRRLCFAYYNFKNRGNLNQVQSAQYPEYISDYQIVMNTDSTNWEQFYNAVDYAPYSKLYLYKKKETTKKIPLLEVTSIKCDNNNQEFYNLFEGSADTLQNKNIFIQTKLTFSSPEKPPIMWIVAAIDDSAGNNIFYEFSALHWKKTCYNGKENNVSCSFSISQLPNGGKRFVVYIWNIHKKQFSISNGQFSVNIIK